MTARRVPLGRGPEHPRIGCEPEPGRHHPGPLSGLTVRAVVATSRSAAHSHLATARMRPPTGHFVRAPPASSVLLLPTNGHEQLSPSSVDSSKSWTGIIVRLPIGGPDLSRRLTGRSLLPACIGAAAIACDRIAVVAFFHARQDETVAAARLITGRRTAIRVVAITIITGLAYLVRRRHRSATHNASYAISKRRAVDDKRWFFDKEARGGGVGPDLLDNGQEIRRADGTISRRCQHRSRHTSSQTEVRRSPRPAVIE